MNRQRRDHLPFFPSFFGALQREPSKALEREQHNARMASNWAAYALVYNFCTFRTSNNHLLLNGHLEAVLYGSALCIWARERAKPKLLLCALVCVLACVCMCVVVSPTRASQPRSVSSRSLTHTQTHENTRASYRMLPKSNPIELSARFIF